MGSIILEKHAFPELKKISDIGSRLAIIKEFDNSCMSNDK